MSATDKSERIITTGNIKNSNVWIVGGSFLGVPTSSSIIAAAVVAVIALVT